jgi:glucosyl-dolichyl phosphate glucuronosyltransferase
MMHNGNDTVSVIICMHNIDRWVDSCEAVQSVRDQLLTPHEIVIVVDHNPALLACAEMQFPDLLVVCNREVQGLSGARNTGIAVSSGSLLAFLDDDAVADPRWLLRLAERCEEPEILGATAKVEPIWVGRRPGWLPEEFLWTLGCSYRGLPTSAQEVRNVFGGAMIMKRQVFDRAGGFTHALGRGRAGAKMMSCEDSELCIRARIAFPRGKIMMEPSAVIGHKVPSSRLTWKYFLMRCYSEGVGKAYLTALLKSRGALGTERSYVLRALSTGFMRGVADFLFRLETNGLKRSAAIVLGLTSAATGYLAGKLWSPVQAPPRRRAEPA